MVGSNARPKKKRFVQTDKPAATMGAVLSWRGSGLTFRDGTDVETARVFNTPFVIIGQRLREEAESSCPKGKIAEGQYRRDPVDMLRFYGADLYAKWNRNLRVFITSDIPWSGRTDHFDVTVLPALIDLEGYPDDPIGRQLEDVNDDDGTGIRDLRAAIAKGPADPPLSWTAGQPATAEIRRYWKFLLERLDACLPSVDADGKIRTPYFSGRGSPQTQIRTRLRGCHWLWYWARVLTTIASTSEADQPPAILIVDDAAANLLHDLLSLPFQRGTRTTASRSVRSSACPYVDADILFQALGIEM